MPILTLEQLLFPPNLHPLDSAMYLSDKPRQIDFYKDSPGEMMIEVAAAANGAALPPQPQISLPESSGEEHEMRAPKKRAETWVQEETRSLISLRREMDGLFNTSKSNKHLWEQISAKMRDMGFDRSPTMCTDKWRNLLKEFKKARHQYKGSGPAKMSYYKELEELLKERSKNAPSKSPLAASKVDSYLHFPEKGLEDSGIPYVSVEANNRSTINLERRLDHEGHHLAITAAEAVTANGVPPWNWRDTSANGFHFKIIIVPLISNSGTKLGVLVDRVCGLYSLCANVKNKQKLGVGFEQMHNLFLVPKQIGSGNHTSYGGKVIIVKWGEYTKKIGIDGTAEAIEKAIKSAFGLRTKRAFWLEDEDEVIRSLDRDMPLGTYTLHLDEGVTIKVCIYEDADPPSLRTEDKTLYTEDDFRDFLGRRGWSGLRELNGFRTVDGLDDLRSGAMYQGIRLLVD